MTDRKLPYAAAAVLVYIVGTRVLKPCEVPPVALRDALVNRGFAAVGGDVLGISPLHPTKEGVEAVMGLRESKCPALFDHGRWLMANVDHIQVQDDCSLLVKLSTLPFERVLADPTTMASWRVRLVDAHRRVVKPMATVPTGPVKPAAAVTPKDDGTGKGARKPRATRPAADRKRRSGDDGTGRRRG